MSSVAENLAELVLKPRFKDLTEEVVHQTKRVLIDSLACLLGGYPSEAAKAIIDMVRTQSKVPESTIIGEGLKTLVPHAILANGVMLRFLDYMDTYVIPLKAGKEPLQGCHPCEIIPLILAIGEKEHLPGKEIITAIVLGYEVQCRLVEVGLIPIADRGFLHTSIGFYAAPLIAGRILGLTPSQIANALGISGCFATLKILDAPGEEYTMMKNAAFSFSAMNGYTAALLAKNGFTGPIRIFEGTKGFIDVLFGGQGSTAPLSQIGPEFKILDVNMKPLAAEHTTHGMLTAVLKLVKENNIKPEDIEAIHLKASTRTTEHTGSLEKRYPRNKETADHSAPYLTAIAILEGKVGPAQFSPEKYSDPKVLDLIGRTTIEADPRYDPLIFAGAAEIETKQGRRYSYEVEYPKGHIKNPMSDEEIEAKFKAIASSFTSSQWANDVLKTIYNLENLSDISKLMVQLVSL